MSFTPEIVTLCHSAVRYGDQLCILGAFASITVDALPFKHPPFALVCRLGFDEEEIGDHVLKVTVLDIDGHVLGQFQAPIHITQELCRLRWRLSIIFPISGMELRCAGDHAIDLTIDERDPLRNLFQVHRKQAYP